MIKRLAAFDFDATLIDSPEPETGKEQWSEKMGKPFPYIGWWGRPESLDLNIFDIRPFPSILNQLKDEQSKPNTYVVILTSRVEKLRPQVQAVLDANGIEVDKLDMKRSQKIKGQKILRYIEEFPGLKEINVYEDRDTDIESYEAIKSQIPENIRFNIYLATNGKLSLLEAKNEVLNIIQEEIQNFIKK
jgi:hypothetical protein